MALEDYAKAYRMGKKDYQYRLLHGMQPTLEVLDDILPTKGSYSEIPLGVVQIPLDQIVGTKNGGRSSAFAGNFMPILDDHSEFALKWSKLDDAHINEGIRDPIKAYEYMNRFYVEEGNKRVSVMKFYGVVSIPGNVTRIVPKRTNEKENIIYYEFMDFYELSQINYIYFSKEGSFQRLQFEVGKQPCEKWSQDDRLEFSSIFARFTELSQINYIYFSKEGSFQRLQFEVGKQPCEKWSQDDRLEFSSIFARFTTEYRAKGGDKLSITVGDAFLSFITLYGYKEVCEKTTKELKTLITKSWEEFELLEKDDVIALKMSYMDTKRFVKKQQKN